MDRYANRDDLDLRAETYRMPVTRRGVLDLGTRRLTLIAGFLTCGLVLVVSVWSVLSNTRSATLPVVEADQRPIRVKPENPGGLQVAGQNEDILSAEAGPRIGQLAPPPEVPAPQALRARQQAAEAAAQAVAPPAPQSVSLPPASQAVPSALPLAAIHQPMPAATTQPHSMPSQAASPASIGASIGGRVQAQLAAVGSEQAAKAEWQRLSKRMPDVLSGRQPVLMKTERDGHTVWRVRTGGFADQAAAAAFCDRVKAKGAGCAVATF